MLPCMTGDSSQRAPGLTSQSLEHGQDGGGRLAAVPEVLAIYTASRDAKVPWSPNGCCGA